MDLDQIADPVLWNPKMRIQYRYGSGALHIILNATYIGAGSTTYQPGDTLGNTTMTLYQRTWTKDLIEEAILNDAVLKDNFDMDPTVGRDVIFQAALWMQNE